MSVNVPTAAKLEVWKNRSFTFLLSSVFLLTIGNKIYEIVLPLMMYEITRSFVSATSMRTAELLPNFCLAIFIGVIVDRVNKKNWAMLMVGCQAVLLFILTYLFKAQIHVMYLYYVIGFLLMSFNYGFFNSQVSLTKLSVPSSQLTSANAKFSFIDTFVSIMGPAITSIILLLADMSDGIMITAFCYLICLFLLKRLGSSETNPPQSKLNFRIDIKEAWSYFRSNNILWGITISVIFLNCTMTVINTTVIFFAKDILKLPSFVLAGVFSASGIGGLLGSLIINKLRSRYGLGRLNGVSVLLSGISYMILFFISNTVSLLISMFLMGFATALHSISVYTFRQEQSPSHIIGRIAGITGMLFRIGMPIAMYLSGWIIVWWGTSSIFITASIWNLLIFIILLKTHIWKLS
ncbi:MFS transporter [Paenibacillus alginolyticus]|uniref:MFS transporter n=1 Tax=Paenibacillus alginolyticus TaxID=59839 RepID=UPI00040DCB81|nr:MFS transporter [Paenibacillus alginolyticus]MCY9666502.1 MFS transporter [Paenibacillus alginolyticus]